MNVNYTQIVINSLQENLDAQDQKKLDTWLSQNNNDLKYQKIKELWDASGTLSYPEIEAHLNVDEAYNKVVQRTKFISIKKNKSKRPYLIAASLALLVAAMGYLTLGVDKLDNYNTITAEANMEYTLPDNSTVWLSKNTELSYHKDFTNNRMIKMNGKAMYDVTHNPQKPFVIDAEGMDVTVLGTRFIVSNEDLDYVHVINGKVQVDDKKEQSERLILTKDMTANRDAGRISLTDDAYANDMFWASQSLKYNNASLEKIFDELETYFDTTIDTDNRFEKCAFNGTFTGENLEDILSTLEVIYELEITKTKETITINGPSCK